METNGLEVRSIQTIAAGENSVAAGFVILDSFEAHVGYCCIIDILQSEFVAVAATGRPA
jgi:hypothetical protein